jgi:hypothetical protein
MPRQSRNEDWETMGTLSTPMKLTAYVDACVQYLVREPSEEDTDCERFSVFTSNPHTKKDHAGGKVFKIACTPMELGHAATPCVFCTNPSTLTVIVNPFAQAHVTRICNACASLG